MMLMFPLLHQFDITFHTENLAFKRRDKCDFAQQKRIVVLKNGKQLLIIQFHLISIHFRPGKLKFVVQYSQIWRFDHICRKSTYIWGYHSRFLFSGQRQYIEANVHCIPVLFIPVSLNYVLKWTEKVLLILRQFSITWLHQSHVTRSDLQRTWYIQNMFLMSCSTSFTYLFIIPCFKLWTCKELSTLFSIKI